MTLFTELKRRNVFRVGIAYLAISWLLIQVVETILPVFGYSDAPIRIVIILLLIGFPITLLVSWVYELTPEGLKKEKDIDPADSLTAHTGKNLDRAIIVVLSLSLVYLAVDKFVLDPARDAKREQVLLETVRNEVPITPHLENSIAVLPFVNMSSDTEQEFFSDGISEELLNLLSKVPDLRVISRSSSFTFKDKDFDIPAIAQQLNVSFILEGSVRRSGEKVRITAQLIDARSDSRLWSETYDRKLDNIFAIQDELSTAIVAALKTELGLEITSAAVATSTTTNPEAHEAYLRGRYLLVQRTDESVTGALTEFRRAIELDPNYALAYAELGIAMTVSYYLPSNELSHSELVELATIHIQRAMALDPNLPQAHAAAGLLRWQQSMNDRLDYYKVAALNNEAVTFYQKAIELNPNYSEAYVWRGMAYTRLGRRIEKFALSQKSVQLDPLNIPALSRVYQGLYERNRMDEAQIVLNKLSSISPVTANRQTEWALWQRGDWSALALRLLDETLANASPEKRQLQSHDFSELMSLLGLKAEALAGPRPLHLLQAIRIGHPDEAILQAEKQLVTGPSEEDNNPAWTYGFIMATVGEYELARPYLDKGWEQMGRQLMFVYSDFDAFAWLAATKYTSDDAAFNEVLERFRERVNYNKEAGLDFNRHWFDEGLLYLLDGKRDEGLALLLKAVDNGYQFEPSLAFMSYLLGDPEFEQVATRFEAIRSEKREQFLSVICNDNPYEDVWQPGEGTCQEFLKVTK